jgi:hypothetical protein
MTHLNIRFTVFWDEKPCTFVDCLLSVFPRDLCLYLQGKRPSHMEHKGTNTGKCERETELSMGHWEMTASKMVGRKTSGEERLQ